MAWLAISKSGKEYIFKRKPKRCKDSWDDAVWMDSIEWYSI